MGVLKKNVPTPRARSGEKAVRRTATLGRPSGGRSRKLGPMAGAATVVVVALVALAAIAANRSGSGGASAVRTESVRISPGGGRVGSQMTSFSLRSISGQHVSVPSAGTPGAIIFSASSCTSCIPTMRALSTLKARLGPHMNVVMISIERGDTAKYLRQWEALIGHVPFPLTIDTTQQLVSAYKVEYTGVTILYNARGRIVDRADEPSMGELEGGLRKAGLA